MSKVTWFNSNVSFGSFFGGYLTYFKDQFGIDDVDESYKMPDYLTSNTALNTMHSMSNVFL